MSQCSVLGSLLFSPIHSFSTQLIVFFSASCFFLHTLMFVLASQHVWRTSCHGFTAYKTKSCITKLLCITGNASSAWRLFRCLFSPFSSQVWTTATLFRLVFHASYKNIKHNARFVFNPSKFSHTTPHYSTLSCNCHIRFKTLMLIYKTKNGLPPPWMHSSNHCLSSNKVWKDTESLSKWIN